MLESIFSGSSPPGVSEPPLLPGSVGVPLPLELPKPSTSITTSFFPNFTLNILFLQEKKRNNSLFLL